MRIPPSTSHWSSLRIPLLLILLWWLLLFLLLMWTQRRGDAYTEELARLQLETLYSSIADMRDWNAENGGVFVRENPESPAAICSGATCSWSAEAAAASAFAML